MGTTTGPRPASSSSRNKLRSGHSKPKGKPATTAATAAGAGAGRKPKKTFSQSRKKAQARLADPGQQSGRRFRYQSFSALLAQINIDPLRLARTESLRAEADAADAQSYFRAALEKWKVTNLSAGFTAYAATVWPVSETLPQIIYHEDTIVGGLLDRLPSAEEVALEPLLNLLSSAAHDLGHRFDRFVGRAVEAISALVLRHTGADVIGWAFSCLVWLFKFLSRLLVRRLPDVLDMMLPLLGAAHKREFVAHFAAEAVAFLVRKAVVKGSEPDSAVGRTIARGFAALQAAAADGRGKVLEGGLVVVYKQAVVGVQQGVHVNGAEIVRAVACAALPAGPAGAGLMAALMAALADDLGAEGYATVSETVMDVFRETQMDGPAISVAAETMFVLLQKLRGEWAGVFETMAVLVERLNSEKDVTLANSQEEPTAVPILSSLAVALARAPHLKTVSTVARQAVKLASAGPATAPHFAPFVLFFLERCSDAERATRARDILPVLQAHIDRARAWDSDEPRAAEFLVRLGEWARPPVAISIPDSWASAIGARLSRFADSPVSDNDDDSCDAAGLLNAYVELLQLSCVRAPAAVFENLADAPVRALELLAAAPDAVPSRTDVFAAGNLLKLVLSRGLLTPTLPLLETVAAVAGRLSRSAAFWEALKVLAEKARLDGIELAGFTEALVPALCEAVSLPCPKTRTIALQVALLIRPKPEEAVGEQDLLQLMLSVQMTPSIIDNIRLIGRDLRRLSGCYSRVAEDGLLGPLLPAFCFGMLSSEISQICDDAAIALADVATHKLGEQAVIARAFAWITQPPPFSDSMTPAAAGEDGGRAQRVRRYPAVLRGALFCRDEGEIGTSLSDLFNEKHLARPFRVTRREQALQVLLKVPALAERRARELVPVLIGWGSSEELLLAGDDESVTAASVSRSWEMGSKKLLLSLFAAFVNPASLFRSAEVKMALLALCANGDVEIQRRALDGYLRWPSAALKKHTPTLRGIIDEQQFRERVALLTGADGAIGAAAEGAADGTSGLSAMDGVVLPEERAEVMTVAVRLLYGRAISRGKGGQQRRRRAVLGALARCEPAEVDAFIGLMLGRLGERGSGPARVSRRKQEGVLAFVKDLLDVFGGTMEGAERVVEGVMAVTLCGGEDATDGDIDGEQIEAEDEDGDENTEDADISNPKPSSERRLRSKALHCLAALLHHYPQLQTWEEAMPQLFAAAISPRLARLAAELSTASAASSALLRLVAEMAASAETVRWLAHDPELIPALASLVALPPVHDAVRRAVLRRVLLVLLDQLVDVAGEKKAERDGRVEELVSASADLFLKATAEAMRRPLDTPTVEAAVETVVKLAGYVKGGEGAEELVRFAGAVACERGLRVKQEVEKAPEEGEKEKMEDTGEENLEEEEDEEESKEEPEETEEGESDKVETPDAVVPPTPTAAIAALSISTPARTVKQKVPYRLRLSALRLLLKYIPLTRIPAGSALLDDLTRDVFQLLSTLGGPSRAILTNVVAALARATSAPGLVAAESILVDMHATAALGAPDFDRRLAAHRAVTEEAVPQLGFDGTRVVLAAALYDVRSTDDMAIRAAATLSVRRIIRSVRDGACGEGAPPPASIIEKYALPAVKRGVRHRDEAIRGEFILILQTVVQAFPTGTSVSGLSPLLMGGDAEANVFSNILHLQPHRRVRAIKRIAEFSSGFSSSVCASVLLPLLDTFIPVDAVVVSEAAVVEKVKVSAVAVECLNTISVLATRLSWSAIRTSVDRLRRELVKNKTPGGLFVKRLRAWVSGLDGWIEARKKDETDLTTQFSYLQVIFRSLSDFFHRQADDTVVTRLDLLGPVAQLLRQLPAEESNTKLMTILTDVANILRSRSVDVRDACRSGINEVLLVTGPFGIQLLLPALKTSLQRGYQRHVLGFTIHSAVIALQPLTGPGDLDPVAADICEVCLEDILGSVGDEKEADEYIGKMKEVKAARSYDTIEQLARVVSPEAVRLVLKPLRDMLADGARLSPRTTRKLDEVLRRAGVGLGANASLHAEAGLVLCHELISSTTTATAVLKHAGASRQVTRSATAAPKIASFGLDLLRLFVKREGSLRTDRMMAGLVPAICDAAISTNPIVQAAAMRALTVVVGMGLTLSTLDSACPLLVAESVRVVEAAVSTSADDAQAALKLVAAVLRHRPGVKVKVAHVGYLLRRIKPELSEPDRHGLPFALVRAVVARQMVLPELYDVMDSVAAIMITNQTRTVREAAAAAYLHFLTDCPQSRDRFGQQVAFFANNLEYRYEEGRQTVMEVLHLVLTKFGDDLVRAEVLGRVFVPVVLRMVNDESERCRGMAALLIRDVFDRVGADEDGSNDGGVRDTITAWLSATGTLKVAALRVWAIYIESETLSSDKTVSLLLSKIKEALEPVSALNVPTGSAFDREDTIAELQEQWEFIFYALVLFDKIADAFPTQAAAAAKVWEMAVDAQRFPHQWVKSAAMRTVSRAVTATVKASSNQDGEEDPFTAVFTADQLGDIALFSLKAMRAAEASEEVLERAAGNVFMLGKHYGQIEGVESAESDDQNEDGGDGESDSDADADAGEPDDLDETDRPARAVDRSPRALLAAIFDTLSRVIRSEDAARTVAGLKGKQSAIALATALLEAGSAAGAASGSDPDGDVDVDADAADVDSDAKPEVTVLAATAARSLLRPLWVLTSAETVGKPVGAVAAAKEETVGVAAALLRTLQQALGTDRYVSELAASKAAAMRTRDERRIKRKLDAVRDPVKAEREKKRKREGEKRRRVEKGREWGGRRRGW